MSDENMNPIHFYRTGDAYGELSNFSAHPFEIDGLVWPTSEHYFQAQKFVGTTQAERIREAKSPMIAARLGRSRAHPLRADWESVKNDVMRTALRAKFTQHPSLKALLLSTGNAEIIEHTTNDRYWADGGDGTGKNMLGRLLMELRSELRDRTNPMRWTLKHGNILDEPADVLICSANVNLLLSPCILTNILAQL